MGTIQTTIGLITGMEIGKTVEQLMALEARPRDLLEKRNEALVEEQYAITELTAKLLSTQYASDNLGKVDLFEKRQAKSSNDSVLTATVTGEPLTGTYQFTPLRTVQSQQLLSSGYRSSTDALGGGTLTLRYGSHVERGADLSLINGGDGVTRGQIRITDRSGASAQIDLSTVQTIDDVLEQINENTTINVTAVGHGDGIRLIDNTGQTVSNLIVQEVGRGTTAASLGLDEINVAASVADGSDVISLNEQIDLDDLNDGNGVRVNSSLPDISYTLRDGTTGEIDFSPIQSGSSVVDEAVTLGDILETINAAAPGKLKVEIAPDGDRLVVTDLTEGEGAFLLESLYDSGALSSLGLGAAAEGGVITGRRLLGGAKSVLLSSLNGGNGYGALGTVTLTDRSGGSDTVNLAGAETLEQLVDILNEADVDMVAQINEAKNGIVLTDTTGMADSNMIVANGDATGTADKLGIAVDATATSAGSGDMHLQVISQNTRLDSLNGGAGVASGTFTIVDSGGTQAEINLGDEEIETIGDVLQAINRSGLRVYAEINETGDGILLRDTGSEGGTLAVLEGTSTAAADLGILKSSEEVDIGGEMKQVINGSMTHVIELGADDSLEDLRDKINNLGGGMARAMIMEDGSNKPYRLSLTSGQSGRAGEMVLDTSGLNLALDEVVQAQDALMVYGSADSAASSILLSSTSNTFSNVVPGLSFEIQQASETPVTIQVSTSATDLVATVQTMVDNYNKFREALSKATAYNAETDERSVLTGDATALRLDTAFSRFFSSSLRSSGTLKTLGQVGISIKDDGTLAFDKTVLQNQFATEPEAVKNFFTAEEHGFSDKLAELIGSMTGEEETNLLTNRYMTLGKKIAENQERISFLNARLEAEEKRLYTQFYNMEIAIGKLQNNLKVIESFEPLKPLSIGSRDR